MNRAAIFDLDGTLLNTLDDIAQGVNYALKRFGLPAHSPECYKAWLGDGADSMVQRASPDSKKGDIALQEQLLTTFLDYYGAHSQVLTRPYDGIVQLLEDLRRQGWKVAILSNKAHQNVPALVEYYFPGIIDLAWGQRAGIPLKPDPQPLLHLLDQLNVEKSNCIYVGDSEIDIQTGINSGVRTIGVTWGFRTKKQLMDSGAVCTVNNVDELRAYFN